MKMISALIGFNVKIGHGRKCGLRTADCGLWIADCGLQIADCGLRTADCGLRTADCGLWKKQSKVPRAQLYFD